MAFPRTLAILAAAAALVVACSHGGTPTGSSTTSGASPATPVAVPVPRSCAEPAGIPALLSPRDKLAQLLVVGVRDAADAQAVVTNYHVGGILIGSDTDLTIFDGALAEIVAGGGPLPLAVSVDEEGGRVSRLRSLIGGTGPSARDWHKPEPSSRCATWLETAAGR